MSDGFGICGHKNHYNSAVKVENWVEDSFGADLARNPSNNPTVYTTDTREKIIDPKDMVNNAGGEDLHLMDRNEIMQQNKGLPSHMLFEHLGAPGADRFMSINNMTFTAGVGSGGVKVEKLLQEKPTKETMAVLDIKPKTNKMVKKSKNDARIDGLVNSFQTEQQAGAKRVTNPGFKVRGADAKPPFPDFRKQRLQISSSSS